MRGDDRDPVIREPLDRGARSLQASASRPTTRRLPTQPPATEPSDADARPTSTTRAVCTGFRTISFPPHPARSPCHHFPRELPSRRARTIAMSPHPARPPLHDTPHELSTTTPRTISFPPRPARPPCRCPGRSPPHVRARPPSHRPPSELLAIAPFSGARHDLGVLPRQRCAFPPTRNNPLSRRHQCVAAPSEPIAPQRPANSTISLVTTVTPSAESSASTAFEVAAAGSLPS